MIRQGNIIFYDNIEEQLAKPKINKPHAQPMNHPKIGSKIKVNPIKKIKDIKAIEQLLKYEPRNLVLFNMGINTNLRASDLINIKAGQVMNLKPMDEITLIEKKTKKSRRISINKTVIKSLNKLFRTIRYRPEEYLFKSRKSKTYTNANFNCGETQKNS